jgi:DNA repair protein RadC
MQIFRRETRGIVNRFLLHQLSFPHCVESLAAAHTRLLPRLAQGNIEELRVLMLSNNDRVMAEMTRRTLGTDNQEIALCREKAAARSLQGGCKVVCVDSQRHSP